MTDNEKINLIDSFDNIDELGEEHFEILKNLSSDEDDFVRSRCAAQLVNFESDESLNLLLRLMEDKDSFVRTEAYDSIAIFENEVVEKALKKAVNDEQDNLARRYAILSWVDVLLSLRGATADDILFLKSRKNIEKSADCCLSCCYGLYLFGVKEELDQILSFLKNSDYHVRCATIALLEDIIDETNEKRVKDSIGILLIAENTVAVKDRAKRFLKEM
jgi:HEAT repeat protein